MKHYYRKHPFCDLDKCYYCGDDAKDLDHVPPISWAYAMGFDYLVEKENAPFLMIPACKQCNTALGDRKYFTLSQRKGFIAAFLRDKYRKLRESPKWDEWELQELDGVLSDYVREHQDIRLAIERRIAFAER